MKEPLELRIDPKRNAAYMSRHVPMTDIYARARNEEGRWGNYDISVLDRNSLDAWLRSRGSIEWPIAVVMNLLDHSQEPTLDLPAMTYAYLCEEIAEALFNEAFSDVPEIKWATIQVDTKERYLRKAKAVVDNVLTLHLLLPVDERPNRKKN